MFDWLDNRLPRSEHLRGALRERPNRSIRSWLARARRERPSHQDLVVRGAGPMIEVFEGRIEIANLARPSSAWTTT